MQSDPYVSQNPEKAHVYSEKKSAGFGKTPKKRKKIGASVRQNVV